MPPIIELKRSTWVSTVYMICADDTLPFAPCGKRCGKIVPDARAFACLGMADAAKLEKKICQFTLSCSAL